MKEGKRREEVEEAGRGAGFKYSWAQDSAEIDRVRNLTAFAGLGSLCCCLALF